MTAPPITPELVDRFLDEYRWLLKSRRRRERLAYRIVEWQRDEMAWLRLNTQQEDRKWTRKVRK
jgi:hypothetical protein